MVASRGAREALELNKADLLLTHGLALVRLGRAKDAVTPLRDALAWREASMDENSPLLTESLIALAECYLAQGERAQARPLIERAQRISPKSPESGRALALSAPQSREAARLSMRQYLSLGDISDHYQTKAWSERPPI